MGALHEMRVALGRHDLDIYCTRRGGDNNVNPRFLGFVHYLREMVARVPSTFSLHHLQSAFDKTLASL